MFWHHIGTICDVISYLICLIQNHKYLWNERRNRKKGHVVVCHFKSDKITLVAQNDSIISTIGTMMVEKVGTKFHDILQNMQNLACLLMSMSEVENNENSQLLQLLLPENYRYILKVHTHSITDPRPTRE